jgi:hypothetical protein
MQDESKSSTYWKPINFGWAYWNYAIIAMGLVVGFCVWVLPNQWADPEVQAGIERVKQQQALTKERRRIDAINKAEEERVARYNEEVGLVYIEPGTNPFLPPDSPGPATPPAGGP